LFFKSYLNVIIYIFLILLEEDEGFEPSEPCGSTP
jgi:hypothetical protein